MIPAELLNKLYEAVGLSKLPGFSPAINGELAQPHLESLIEVALRHHPMRERMDNYDNEQDILALTSFWEELVRDRLQVVPVLTKEERLELATKIATQCENLAVDELRNICIKRLTDSHGHSQ